MKCIRSRLSGPINKSNVLASSNDVENSSAPPVLATVGFSHISWHACPSGSQWVYFNAQFLARVAIRRQWPRAVSVKALEARLILIGRWHPI